MREKCNHVPDDLLCQTMGEKGKCPGHPWQDLGNHAAVTAYGLAVAAGFRGSLKEWLDSLVGPRGERGEAFTYDMFTPEQLEGLIGPTGPEGPQGPEGDPFTYDDFTPEQLAGLVGPTGPTGADGNTFVQNGMFYLRYDEDDGHLYVGVPDNTSPPPLSIDDNGHLV